jgi:IMP dehydrogenase
MAQEGGLGFVHKNLSIEAQAAEVAKVKRFESGTIVDPITLGPDQPIQDALDIMHQHHISGLPVVRREAGRDRDQPRPAFRAQPEGPVDGDDERGPDHRSPGRVDGGRLQLPMPTGSRSLVVDDLGNLCGLITIKDIEKQTLYRTRTGPDGPAARAPRWA